MARHVGTRQKSSEVSLMSFLLSSQSTFLIQGKDVGRSKGPLGDPCV